MSFSPASLSCQCSHIYVIYVTLYVIYVIYVTIEECDL